MISKHKHALSGSMSMAKIWSSGSILDKINAKKLFMCIYIYIWYLSTPPQQHGYLIKSSSSAQTCTNKLWSLENK
ncbi:hypothetical protein DAPPUDRAFT_315137 [Daphnia pulex]|uniref:Uncharacterized protein n=1 Tax=Daphnia pulex TaxID=6669 RepID=E9G8V3_DAPPU|nr:hypothetical protein DAPPUDRAFT_315137 [Daphnia pulex]|eukprot:EFX84038.1 hypothetical protein DAPPUDRAFT_315137 [Daphnia pulex]